MEPQSGTYRDGERAWVCRSLNQWLNGLMGVTLLVYVVGLLTFGEKFSWREHAFSYFGMIRTPDGSSNILCLLFFVLGVLLSAMICFRISRLLQSSRSHWLFWLAGVGYLVMLIPCDIYNPGLMIGAALLFFSLWFFTLLHAVRLIHHTGWLKFLFVQLILQGTVLPYAWMYFTGSPDKQFVQKLALAGLILSLKLVALEMSHHAEQLTDRRDSSVHG